MHGSRHARGLRYPGHGRRRPAARTGVRTRPRRNEVDLRRQQHRHGVGRRTRRLARRSCRPQASVHDLGSDVWRVHTVRRLHRGVRHAVRNAAARGPRIWRGAAEHDGVCRGAQYARAPFLHRCTDLLRLPDRRWQRGIAHAGPACRFRLAHLVHRGRRAACASGSGALLAVARDADPGCEPCAERLTRRR